MQPPILREAGLARTFAALAEPARLRIVALLARRPHYAEELAEATGLHPTTISHHLRALIHVELVHVERRSPYRLFSLETDHWETLRANLALLDQWTERFDLPPEEQISGRLLRRYVDDDGRVHTLPRQARPLDVVLRHVAADLEIDRLYPQRELRLRLANHCHDADAMIEALVRRGWVQRVGTVLRRVARRDEA